MTRDFFRKYLPHMHRVRQHRAVRIFGTAALRENLWHLNRRSVARAFAIGLFCAFMPIPAQMLLAAGLAILIPSNLPLAVLLVWVTNPITIPPIFLFCYWIGASILGIDPQPFAFEWSWHWFTSKLHRVGLPLLIGGLTCGLTASVVGYLSIYWYWHWYVVRIWRTRHKPKVEKALHDIFD